MSLVSHLLPNRPSSPHVVALVLCKVLTVPRFLLYCVAQLVGAIVASAILDGLTPGPLAVATSLGAGVGIAQGVFIEMFVSCSASVLTRADERADHYCLVSGCFASGSGKA